MLLGMFSFAVKTNCWPRLQNYKKICKNASQWFCGNWFLREIFAHILSMPSAPDSEHLIKINSLQRKAEYNHKQPLWTLFSKWRKKNGTRRLCVARRLIWDQIPLLSPITSGLRWKGPHQPFPYPTIGPVSCDPLPPADQSDVKTSRKPLLFEQVSGWREASAQLEIIRWKLQARTSFHQHL